MLAQSVVMVRRMTIQLRLNIIHAAGMSWPPPPSFHPTDLYIVDLFCFCFRVYFIFILCILLFVCGFSGRTSIRDVWISIEEQKSPIEKHFVHTNQL